VTVAGDCIFGDVAQALAEGFADRGYAPQMPVLIDARLSTANPSSEAIHTAGRNLAQTNPQSGTSRWAIVSGEGAHQFGIARMASLTLETFGFHMEVFRDLEEAVRWLTQGRATHG